MNTKLTLIIEQSLIQSAKKYAKRKGRSLSDIIENYLKVITKENDKQKVETTHIARLLRGSFNTPHSFDYKKELTKILSEKYL